MQVVRQNICNVRVDLQPSHVSPPFLACPAWHSHVKLPTLLTQSELSSQPPLSVAHSSMSTYTHTAVIVCSCSYSTFALVYQHMTTIPCGSLQHTEVNMCFEKKEDVQPPLLIYCLTWCRLRSEKADKIHLSAISEVDYHYTEVIYNQPAQVIPSPSYPALQLHSKLPGTLLQLASTLHPPLFVAHSSISVKKRYRGTCIFFFAFCLKFSNMFYSSFCVVLYFLCWQIH